MTDDLSDHEKWAHIFNEFGEETLREMLLKAARKKQQEDGRIIFEFEGDRAMDVSEHVSKLEEKQ